jgi:hypothetical protein
MMYIMGKRLVHIGDIAASDMRTNNGHFLPNRMASHSRSPQNLHTPLVKASELKKGLCITRLNPLNPRHVN